MSDNHLTIRMAEHTDCEAVARIYGYAVLNETASFELEAPGSDEMRRRMDTTLSSGFPYLVAEKDGLVVGFAYLSAFHPRPAYRWTVENSIYIDPDYRGQSVGKQLLKSLIDHAEAQGYRQLIAVLGGADYAASKALHQSCGFRDAGMITTVGYKHGTWHDVVFLQRSLGEGDQTPPDDLPL